MTYRDRRMAKAERLREWADKREAKAEALEARNAPYRGDIAFCTQPGHIPERARAIARTEKAWEHSAKARDFSRRADGIEAAAERAIYSDDPDAADRLRDRLEELEAERDRIKRYNASCRKGSPDLSVLSDAQRADLEGLARVAAWQMKGGAFPSYVLSNLSGNIKRNRDRLAEMERADA